MRCRMIAKKSVKRVIGNCLLLEVKVEDDSRETRSDTIIIPEEFANTEKNKILATSDNGIVRQIGSMAFIRLDYDEQPCEIGDRIMIIPNTGYLIHDEKSDKYYRVIKDSDVLAILE